MSAENSVPRHAVVAGLRGIPHVEGGIESVCENLYPQIAESDWRVTVIVRSPYYDRALQGRWGKIKLVPIWAPKLIGAETLIHSFLATIYAIVKRPEIFHLHAVGPGLMAPLARLFGLRVVVTHHGQDYEREKWGFFARNILRLGEFLGMAFANERIVISQTIHTVVREKYGLDSHVIPNGVNRPTAGKTQKVLNELDLTPGKYVIQVSRFVPEKRQIDLINAFAKAKIPEWKLVFAGDTEVNTPYMAQVRKMAECDNNVVLAGFRTGSDLEALLENAGVFVLPSSHEGLPIALLEALSHGLLAIASDIPANLEVGLGEQHYFPVGDVHALSERLKSFADMSQDRSGRRSRQEEVLEKYNWARIAKQTTDVYRQQELQSERTAIQGVTNR